MEQPFAKFKDSFSEMYEVVKTAEVIRNGTRYRIDILKDHTAFSKFKVK